MAPMSSEEVFQDTVLSFRCMWGEKSRVHIYYHNKSSKNDQLLSASKFHFFEHLKEALRKHKTNQQY